MLPESREIFAKARLTLSGLVARGQRTSERLIRRKRQRYHSVQGRLSGSIHRSQGEPS